MRSLIIAGVLAALALTIGPPSVASAEPCEGASCGVPKCWEPQVRVRPGMTRTVRFSCLNVTGAKLVAAPAHSDISNVEAEWSGVSFDARPREGAPRFHEAVFELTGHEGAAEVRVRIEVVPLSENSAPICEGDRVSQRSDGTGPVDVFLHPYCRDPDGDDFVMEGGPPGTHRSSPKRVPAGESESNWDYRTATFSGSETSRIWATDSLGARSSDALLDVTVGPGVDRLPECRPNPASWYGGGYEIGTRAGRTRRLGMICTDPEADPFTARVSTPPERGELALLEIGDPAFGYWGADRWIDALYRPKDDSPEPDRFALTASGDRGEGPPAQMSIIPRPPWDNRGGGCGYSGAGTLIGVPTVLRVSCVDDEGDPLSAEIVTSPRHGVATPPVITPSRYGSEEITVAYEPNPGHEGYDCVEIRISDGHGTVFTIAIDIWVRAPLPENKPPVGLPPLPSPPPLPIGHFPPGTIPTPGQIRDQAEQILGTEQVKPVQTVGNAQVWARSKLSRKELMRRGHAPGLVLLCTADCRVRTDAELATGLPKVRATRQKAVAALRAGESHVLSLALTPSERRALRRSRKPLAKFKLAIRAGQAPAKSVRRTIPIRG